MASQATARHSPSRLQDSPSVLSHLPLRLGPVTHRRRVPCGSEGPVRSLPLDHAHRPQELSRPTGFAGARLARARPSAYMGAQPDQPVRPVRISSRINGARAPASPLLIMQGRTSGAVRGLRVSILPPDSGSTGHPHTATIARSGSSLPGAFRHRRDATSPTDAPKKRKIRPAPASPPAPCNGSRRRGATPAPRPALLPPDLSGSTRRTHSFQPPPPPTFPPSPNLHQPTPPPPSLRLPSPPSPSPPSPICPLPRPHAPFQAAPLPQPFPSPPTPLYL